MLLDPNGSIAATYRKIHLFDVSVDDGPVDTESARVSPGDTPVVADVDGVRLGLSVCYDLRFPSSRTLALAGAEVLAVPSNFTERTGRDHWEVLLRARAIENGAWVLALASRADRRGNLRSGGRWSSIRGAPWSPRRPTVLASSGRTWRRTASPRSVVRSSLANRRPEAYRLV